jgi:hypothetical protein
MGSPNTHAQMNDRIRNLVTRRAGRALWSPVERGLVLPAAALALLSVPSCHNEADTIPQDTPVLDRTSIHYMLPAIVSAHETVLNAEAMLVKHPPDVDAARESLGKARQALANLEWFYIPATEARDNVYNSYREHLAGHPEERNAYLDLAKQELLQIAERSSGQTESYVEDLANRLETVQLHIRDGMPIHDELKSLCEIFQLHLLKAQLVLDENAFEKHGGTVSSSPKEVENVKKD